MAQAQAGWGRKHRRLPRLKGRSIRRATARTLRAVLRWERSLPPSYAPRGPGVQARPRCVSISAPELPLVKPDSLARLLYTRIPDEVFLRRRDLLPRAKLADIAHLPHECERGPHVRRLLRGRKDAIGASVSFSGPRSRPCGLPQARYPASITWERETSWRLSCVSRQSGSRSASVRINSGKGKEM